jgi:DNA-binding transcriptional LysR family regulator
MDLAPSVVTRLVAGLEQHLGARLLTRTTRSVALTPIGQRYLERVRRVLCEMEEAAAAVKDEHCQLRGRVHIAAPGAFAAFQLVPRLARLHEKHPDIALDITTAAATDSPSQSGDIHIVVQPNRLDGGFIAHPLARSQVVLCAAPEYLRRYGRPRHPDDLTQHAMLLAGQNHLPRAWVLTSSANLGDVHPGTTVAFTPGHVAFSSEAVEVGRAAALAGLGIAALPSFVAHDDLLHQRLERVLVHWRLFDLAVHACLPSRKRVPAAVRAVLNFLRGEFPAANADPWLADEGSARHPLRLAA